MASIKVGMILFDINQYNKFTDDWLASTVWTQIDFMKEHGLTSATWIKKDDDNWMQLSDNEYTFFLLMWGLHDGIHD